MAFAQCRFGYCFEKRRGILRRYFDKRNPKIDKNQEKIGDNIDGPWNTATKCIGGQGVEDSNNSFYLLKKELSVEREFKKSPRVGLFFKKEADLEYICKPWRYNTIPIKTQKGKPLLFLQLFQEKDDYCHKVIKDKTTKKNYEEYFLAGKKMNIKDFIDKKMTVDRTCQLFGCYIKDYKTNKL